MPHATSSGLDWPFRSRKRLEKKLADSAVREVTETTEHPIHPIHTAEPSGEAPVTGKQPNREAKLVLTVTEAAEVLGLSRGLAYELVRTGAIPSIRFGRRLVVPKVRLEALLQTGSL